MRKSAISILVLFFAVALTGCPDNPVPDIRDVLVGGGETHIEQFVSGVSAGGASAVLMEGPPPASDGDVPQIDVTGSQHVINGGSAQIDVTGASAFDQIAVFMPGVMDYWVVGVPAGTSAELLLYVPQDVRVSGLRASFMGANGGLFGPEASHTMSVVRVGTGDVQVSLVWDKPSDIDLHVVDPDGEEIFYGNTTAASGGRLDLDSNAGCAIDGVNNENITWPGGRGIAGTYTVRVDNWDSCGAEPIEWAVTIHSGDQQLQTFTGTFFDAGDNGGIGDGVHVTDFTYTPPVN